MMGEGLKKKAKEIIRYRETPYTKSILTKKPKNDLFILQDQYNWHN